MSVALLGRLMAQASSIPQHDTLRLLVREPPNHLADYSTIAATVAAICRGSPLDHHFAPRSKEGATPPK